MNLISYMTSKNTKSYRMKQKKAAHIALEVIGARQIKYGARSGIFGIIKRV
jgi:hypothetical protein